MKILLSHPTGNSNVRAIIKSLEEANLLAEFNTTIAFSGNSSLLSVMSKRMGDQLLRRSFPLSSQMVKLHPLTELARILLPKLGFGRLTKQEHSVVSIDSVYRNLDQNVARRIKLNKGSNRYTSFYGYEDGAFDSFKAAREQGMTCIYDLPIAYWETARKLMEEEALRLPTWAETLGGGIKDSQEKLRRKTLEMEMADIVVAPSAFVLESIPQWAEGKHLITAPFGSPEAANYPVVTNNKRNNGKLRVLFAGSMSQRKGLGDLFEAIKLLNTSEIELIVMGSLMVPIDFYKTQLPSFVYMPPRPHQQVLELMRSCDLLCLPSIVEGRALVMQEAMSQGLPIIITPNSGGADLVEEGQTGFLVPIRSAEAIAGKLNWFLENKAQIAPMRVHAQKHAASYTWEAYGKKIVSAIKEFTLTDECV